MATTRDLFADHNLRCTTQRRALYEALVQDKTHPTAEELYRKVKPHTSRLSLATVYNTLEALCKVGLARKLPTSNGCCRYDADTREHLHVHVGATDEIVDVPADLSTRLIEKIRLNVVSEIERELGIDVDGVNLQLVGRRHGHG